MLAGGDAAAAADGRAAATAGVRKGTDGGRCAMGATGGADLFKGGTAGTGGAAGPCFAVTVGVPGAMPRGFDFEGLPLGLVPRDAACVFAFAVGGGDPASFDAALPLGRGRGDTTAAEPGFGCGLSLGVASGVLLPFFGIHAQIISSSGLPATAGFTIGAQRAADIRLVVDDEDECT